MGVELADLLAVDRGRIAKGGKTFCLHWYREVSVEGVWAYFQCRCGRRRADRVYVNLMGPLDRRWLAGGDWTPPPTFADVPNRGGLPPARTLDNGPT